MHVIINYSQKTQRGKQKMKKIKFEQIANWFIKKNGYEALEEKVLIITQETKKAVQLNNDWWVPKSVIAQGEEIEEKQDQEDVYIKEEIDVDIKRNNSGKFEYSAYCGNSNLVKPWGGVQDDSYLPDCVDVSDLKFEYKNKLKGGGFEGRLYGIVRYKEDLGLTV